MPRLDYRVSAEEVLTSYELQLLLGIVLQELNQIRQWLGQPVLDRAALNARIRAYLQAHPRVVRGAGEEA